MKDFEQKIDTLIDKLKNFESRGAVFNPWADTNENDCETVNAPLVRRQNLKKYLLEHKSAKYILLAESPSYGCHYTGIAMTSEDVIQNKYPQFFNGYKTTSKSGNVKETTASIVWEVINKNEKDFVLWNTFVLQTYKENAKGDFSPRKPKQKEIATGLEILKDFLELFNERKIISVGRTAQNTLLKYNLGASEYVRHPSFGGKNDFCSGMKNITKI